MSEDDSDDEITVTATINYQDEDLDPDLYTKIEVSQPAKNANEIKVGEADFKAEDLNLRSIPKKVNEDFLKQMQKETDQGQLHSERRLTPRHDLRLKVILFSNSKSFKTLSNNISLSGMLLESAIPKEYMGGVFDIVIVSPLNNNEKIVFSAKLVGDVLDPRRIMFVDQKQSFKNSLEKLISNYIEMQKNINGKK